MQAPVLCSMACLGLLYGCEHRQPCWVTCVPSHVYILCLACLGTVVPSGRFCRNEELFGEALWRGHLSHGPRGYYDFRRSRNYLGALGLCYGG